MAMTKASNSKDGNINTSKRNAMNCPSITNQNGLESFMRGTARSGQCGFMPGSFWRYSVGDCPASLRKTRLKCVSDWNPTS